MVDYSKWDKLVCSEDENGEETSRPTVTKLSGSTGGKVHIGPLGTTVQHGEEERKEQRKSSSALNRSASSLTVNGANKGDYFWSQDRNEVNLGIHVEDIPAKHLSLAIHGRELILRNNSTKSVVLSKTMEYDVRLDDESEITDWEIETISFDGCPRRYIRCSLKKASPIPGATIWWKKLFAEEDEEIDVSGIKGRGNTSLGQDAWDEAHRLFRERIANRERIAVELPPSEEGSVS